MRFIWLAFALLVFESCTSDSPAPSKCTLSHVNGIENLSRHGVPEVDSLIISIGDEVYKLKAALDMGTLKFYDFKLRQDESVFFEYANDTLTATAIFYYPADSAEFNNSSYLGKHNIRDFAATQDRKRDSIVYVNECAMNLYLQIKYSDGRTLKSEDKNNLLQDYYYIDSIQYVPRDQSFTYAQFKSYGHFVTNLKDINSGLNKRVQGRIITLFVTDKN